jgi:hypothetical protein
VRRVRDTTMFLAQVNAIVYLHDVIKLSDEEIAYVVDINVDQVPIYYQLGIEIEEDEDSDVI